MIGTEVQPGTVRRKLRARAAACIAERAVVLRGRAQIRELAPSIECFVSQCDDSESLGSLTVWMRDVQAHNGVPLAALVYERGVLEAVLLAVELEVAGLPVRLGYGGNVTGHCGLFTLRGVQQAERSARLVKAADALMACGLVGLLLSVKEPVEKDSLASPFLLATATREVYDTFDLQGDFDASVARLGAHTRRNLRYYRRRAEGELGSVFRGELAGAELRDALLDLSKSMKTEISPAVLKNRIAHVTQRPEAFCMGVQARDGRWLSWVSGWRSGTSTYVDWQCNRDGMGRYSLSTVMRAHLIERESLRGQQDIRFLGGTPHTMHYGFREEACTDFLLVRPGVLGAALGAALRGVAELRRRTKKAPAEGGGDRPKAPRRHPLAKLLIRMVGVVLRQEA